MLSQRDFEQLIGKPIDKASVEDIFYCFRLILGRNPNPEERIGHFARVGEPLTEIVRSYTQSLEFERRNLLRAKDTEGITLVQHDGIALYVDPKDPDVGCHVVTGIYEPHVQAMFHRFLGPDMVALDIGANIGVFTMLAARLVGPKGKVIAIEPNPANVKLIELSRRYNGFAHVDIHCVAAAESAGLLVLYPSGTNGMVAPPNENVDALLRSSIVPAINLDALIPNDLHIDFIKIDVERYELKALTGLKQSLRRCRPVIVSEFSPTSMEPGEGEAYLTFLTELGYDLGVVQPDGSLAEHGADIAAVISAHAASGVDHIDIIAQPSHDRERRPLVAGTVPTTRPSHVRTSGARNSGAASSMVATRAHGAHLVGLLNRHVLSRFDARLIRRTTFDHLLNQAAAHQVGSSLPQPVSPATAECQQATSVARESRAVKGGPRLLSSLDELDEILKECDTAAAVSDDALREAFKTFEFKLPAIGTLPDPFSPEYRDLQFELYRRISGREYALENEFTDWLNPDDAVSTPFPFYTNSYQTVSDHILMLGLIIKLMALRPGAKILEFGCGFGNTTVNLSRMGYHVTAVDIDPRYLQIVDGRCKGFVTPPRTVRGDFSLINELDEQFDAVLFYESFHHCSDHQSLVASFDRRVAGDGIVVFASEPIYEENPIPWGLRLDGQSLWAVRRFGWLELGFKESYFRELLNRSGWESSKHQFPVTDLGTIFVAKRRRCD